jgi:DnaJ family protein A protein 2
MPSSKPKKEVNTTKFYEILEVPKTASQDEIRKSYRKKAVKHHPDKGGDPEKVSAKLKLVQRALCSLRNSFRSQKKRGLRQLWRRRT